MLNATLSVILTFAASSAQAESSQPACIVFIRNNLSLPAHVWVDGNAKGRIPARATEKLTVELTDARSIAQLIMASKSDNGDVYGATLALDLRKGSAGIDCWFGGVRPPYAAERESADAIDTASVPADLLMCVQQVLADGHDAGADANNADESARKDRVSQDATFSRVVIGSTDPVRKAVTNSIDMKFVELFPGEFLMGCPATEQGFTAPERQHLVWLTEPFLIGETEVTQAQWKAVMDDNPSHFRGDDLPIESITWHQANEFCRRLSEMDGRTYRLPTEAEWEYACRAGTRTAFSFGASMNVIDQYAWTNQNAEAMTHPVRSKRPNAWGIYDMHGNVLEWCADWWAWRYPIERTVNPTGPETGTQKTARGGRWSYSPIWARSAARDAKRPGDAYSDLGFRVVLEQTVSSAVDSKR